MPWWKRALLLTLALLLLASASLFILSRKRYASSPEAEPERASAIQVQYKTVGQAAGYGVAMAWFLAFVFRIKP